MHTHPCACRGVAGIALSLLVLLTAADVAAADRPAPWAAKWIGYPDSPGDSYEVLFFRRSLVLEEVPDSFRVHVSADNRYRLFVNGASVATGPARGDLEHWRYETVDLAPHLQTGENVIAAVVWNYAQLRPVAQISLRTGFVLQGVDSAAAAINTNEEWQVLKSTAHEAVPIDRAALNYTYIVVGPGERLDGRSFPWDWNEPGVTPRGTWVNAEVVGDAYPQGSAPYGASVSWQLIPREIPLPEERPVRLNRIVWIEDASGPFAASEGFLRGDAPLTVPANTSVVMLLDHGHLTTGYPMLRTSGGSGASVRLVYAEALFDENGDKGNRNEVAGKHIRGIRDQFVLDGGEDRTYSTLWWRTWRYVQLSIETGDEPLRVEDFHGLFTAYPFEQKGSFAADDPDVANIWEVGWRTARLCAGETYFDCPYYEQIQYVGDTRIQALISLYVAGDDRLMRKAIQDFAYSRVASGLTASRHPVYEPQYIPPYSLFWVAMVHDYWMHRDDPAFVEQHLNGIRGVLDWYEGYVDETDMLGPMPWWNFVDWSYDRSGVPPGADDGHSTVIALQYVYALDMAAELSRAFGRTEEAADYERRSSALKSAVQEHTWDPGRGLYADTPEKDFFTEHTNVMAILVDLVPDSAEATFMQHILDADDLLKAGFYYRFYLHRALKKAGLGDRYVEQLQPWRDMLAVGLTTFAENPGRTRSDCHAWSAAPNYDFLSLVAGVVPDAPGFRRVRVAPSLGPLTRVKAVVAHPAGAVEVALERSGPAGISGTVTLPDGVEGTFEWNGREVGLVGGANEIAL
ncbi:MAG TPA: family 78 glycoside hydrolase catalytic domain [Rhodothermales bacterium]